MIKSEAASWYRIMEMFHFHAFHMYGIMMRAVATGLIGAVLLKRYDQPRTRDGDAIVIPQKEPGRYNFLLGGLIFGLGWGLIGLRPGPIFALVGMGSIGALAALARALHGTWLYGLFENRFPH